jgi:Spy/CpxP family protein refolding chaperone
MRQTLSVCLLALAVAASAQMQPPAGQPPKPLEPKEAAGKFVERITKDLSLTPDQAKKILAIAEPAAVAEADLLKKLRDHQRSTHEKIRALLDNEQREKFDLLRLRRGPQPGAGPDGAMPPKPAEAGKKAPAKAAAPAPAKP